ncbi:MAG TPA: hypothetical protein VK419_10665 [Bryobacteraceae bacterium]|nr:hypothetical protein [Bryobacteraceae bacterium]
MAVNTFFEDKVERISDVAVRIATALENAGVPYRVIGGFAIFSYVDQIDPLKARLTRDIDMMVDRRDLERIARTVESCGFVYRHVAGADMLLDAHEPKARNAVHLVFAREKVRPEYVEPMPDFSAPARTGHGILLASVADLVRMKLTSFRMKDRVHIQDMDSVGLITPEIEASLSDTLRGRLAEVRASE